LIILKKITVIFCVVRGPGAVQLVTSPADQADVSKVAVFDVENCRLTCFSRSGHQFVITNKDEFVIQVDISKSISFIFYSVFKFIVAIRVKFYIHYQNEKLILWNIVHKIHIYYYLNHLRVCKVR
jgi:hypothetical protein